ncbi:hypothetical protein [Humidisolicoccus flavus]|uniref:hypothetical protein n=1 Tax=Humidisolicoccus flavus TaxID=3111414 RepID=UPI0032492B29
MREQRRPLSWRLGVGVVAIGAVVALSGCRPTPPPPAPPEPSDVDLSQFSESDPTSNGLWLLDGDRAADQINRAVAEAGSASIEGTFTELVVVDPEQPPVNGRTVTIAYDGTPERMTAKISAGNIAIDVVVLDGRTYVQGNDVYAQRTGIPEFAEGYVCTNAGEALLSEWSPMLNPRELIETLLAGSDSLSVMPPAEEGETLDVIVGSGDAPVGKLVVEGVGAPLPSAFTAGDSSGNSSFTFTAWGESPEVSIPENIARSCDS